MSRDSLALKLAQARRFARMSNCAYLDARITVVGRTEELIDNIRFLRDPIQGYTVRLNSVGERAAEIAVGTHTNIP